MSALATSLDAIAQAASKFTGRKLRWTIDTGLFRLEDDTAYGNLTLKLLPDGDLREVYMRMRHFGLRHEDCVVIKQALHAAALEASEDAWHEEAEEEYYSSGCGS